MFLRYPHLERFGHIEVEGIEDGLCYVFPKLDGTNAQVWMNKHGELKAGSRSRTLAADSDNAGFRAWVMGEDGEKLDAFFAERPRARLYGEWLVPHTLRTYTDEAWRRFWIFDVYDDDAELFVPWRDYTDTLDKYELDHITPLEIIHRPTLSDLVRACERNTFLMKDGAGAGEGVVVKRYGWSNQWGKTTWAKVVRNEFKEGNKRVFGIPAREGESQVEAEIVEEFVTKTLVEKSRAKVMLAERERAQLIPLLLQTVYYDLVREELWGALKRHKDPTVDFRRLRRLTTARVKALAADLF